jgi:hypothetical protein
MKLFGFKIPEWALVLVLVIVVVLGAQFVWATVTGLFWFILKLVAAVAVIGGIVWGVKKYNDR